jgi:RNA polymerase sigma-70 factor (ECF subfamily)
MALEPRSAPRQVVDAPSAPSDSTFDLLARARAGDDRALEPLFARYLPRLRRWASGRLPRWARDAGDTQDLVQDTLLSVFKQIDGFEPRHEGAFQAYLRQAVMNRIRNAIRDRTRRPDGTSIDEALPSIDQSALERAIGLERLERYEAALARLRPIDREAIVARVEMGCTYEEMAVMLDLPSAEAARKAAQRALVRLAAAFASKP